MYTSCFRYLSSVLPRSVRFTERLFNSDLKVLFTTDEMEVMKDRWKEQTSITPNPLKNVFPKSGVTFCEPQLSDIAVACVFADILSMTEC